MSNDMNKMIGYNLKTVRIERGWSQEFVAKEVGISIRSLSRLETGRSVSKKMIKRLCLFYRISVEALYKEEDTSKNTIEAVDLIPEDVLIRLLLSSSFMGEVQRETILRFNDAIQREALMMREDVEQMISDILTTKKMYTLSDMITVSMIINQKTLSQIKTLAIA